MSSKKYAEVNHAVCVSCGTCGLACPKQAIAVVKGCFAQVNRDTCVGCGRCAGVCPVGCIDIMEKVGGK